MKTIEDLKKYCTVELNENFKKMENRREALQAHWGRFFKIFAIALVLCLAASSFLSDYVDKDSPLPSLLGGVPLMYVFFGSIFKALRSAYRQDKFRQEFAEEIGSKLAAFLIPGLEFKMPADEIQESDETGVFSGMESMWPTAAFAASNYQIRIGEFHRARSESGARPAMTMMVLNLAGQWQGVYSARQKIGLHSKAEEFLGFKFSEVTSSEGMGHEWEGFQEYQTGKKDYDAAFFSRVPSGQEPVAIPSSLRDYLLNLARALPHRLFFGIKDKKAFLVLVGEALFWMPLISFSKAVDLDEVCRSFYDQAKKVTLLAEFPL